MLTKYVEYIMSHTEKLALLADKEIHDRKGEIRKELLDTIRKYITPPPIHYVWQHDGCPYDCSGEIVKNGFVSLDQTVNEFLDNEYTGNTVATYMSGMGLRHETYGDDLSYITLNIASAAMLDAIRKHLEEVFGEQISDEDLDEVRFRCDEFDAIYCECLAYDFFCYEQAIEFVDIGNIKLKDIARGRAYFTVL